jgi:SIR2-like domain
VSKLATLANEDHFPGNTAALADLLDVLANQSPTAVAGAGVSVPLAPAWTPLLNELITTGVTEGFIEESDRSPLLEQMSIDPLELASTLEEQYTSVRFRSRLAQIFDLKGQYTLSHETLSMIAQRGIITFNYDEGLSTAFARKTGNMPRVIRADDKYELTKWMHGESFADGRLPIIHWHGSIAAPNRMVLTADDYNQFYSKPDNRTFLEDLWRSQRLLVVGFSFSDPFLTRIAESVLRSLETDNQHFAIIGYRDAGQTSPLMRRAYSRKYRLTPIFYPITLDETGCENHSALAGILTFLLSSMQAKMPLQAAKSAVPAIAECK